MSDRRLIVGEFDPAEADNGKLFGLDPVDAKGIPIPTFDVGIARPTVGTLKGQAYFDSLQKQGFVWDGTGWRSIAPNPILTYPNEAALLKDTAATPGSYGTAGDTGSLFIKAAAGWRAVGVKAYNTAADLFGDNPTPGSLAEVLDEGSLWERKQNGWRLLIVREMPTTTEIVAWDRTSPGASKGDQAYDKQHDVLYVRTSKHWRPVSLWESDEANIRAATWCLNGQEAIATDTGRTFTRVNDQWIEEPINHFKTEALLLAATAANGTLAWADDTNVVFTRAANAWHRLQGPQISVGDTTPATPGAGDQWFQQTAGQLNIWDGSKWRTSAPEDKRFWEANIHMGANATVGNQVVLIKNITPTNDGIFASIVDAETRHNGGRAAYTIHCFTTDSVGNASAAPVHMEVSGTRFNNLHWFWKDATDGYVIAATVSEACVGATFKVGLFSATADLSATLADGNTTTTDTTSGTNIKAEAYPPDIAAAVLASFPTITKPGGDDSSSGAVTGFSWRSVKAGTHHRWSLVAGTSNVTPVGYFQGQSGLADGVNKRIIREGILTMGDGNFELGTDDTVASSGARWPLRFGWSTDTTNLIKAGTHMFVDVNWFESSSLDMQIMVYLMKYTREDGKKCVLNAKMYFHNFTAHPIIGYALNSFSGAPWKEVKFW